MLIRCPLVRPSLLSLACFLALTACQPKADSISNQPEPVKPIAGAKVQTVEREDQALAAASISSPLQPKAQALGKVEAVAPSVRANAALKADVMEAEADIKPGLSMRMEKKQISAEVLRQATAPILTSAMVMPEVSTEGYQKTPINGIKAVSEQPVSTFSLDVDTGSYANVRRFLNQGQKPPVDAVRVEELINYFPATQKLAPLAASNQQDAPFVVNAELAPCPWNSGNWLLKLSVQAQEMHKNAMPPANLVFLVDVSGSMNEPNKLPLLKSSLSLLVNQLREQDRVSMVIYASGTGVVLESTSGADKARIINAIDRLQAGGGTAGEAGLKLAYQQAFKHLNKDGINRIILATDGDFNIGDSDINSLKQQISQMRSQGVSLSTLGFGQGNYQDALMEQLADVGNGNYSYIDNLHEGHKVLVEQLSSTLVTVAKDVKVQLEFNPAQIREYRQIGYDNRQLAREDFNNDQVDAGDIGAGHRTTVLYELTPAASSGLIDSLRYQAEPTTKVQTQTGLQQELAWLKLRYKQPNSDSSQLLQWPLTKSLLTPWSQVSRDFELSTAVAAFGQKLRGQTLNLSWNQIKTLAQPSLAQDPFGYHAEFIRLLDLAQAVAGGS